MYAFQVCCKKKWCDQKNKYETCSLCSQMLMSLLFTCHTKEVRKKITICISMALFVAVTAHVAYNVQICLHKPYECKSSHDVTTKTVFFLCYCCCVSVLLHKKYFQFISATNSLHMNVVRVYKL